ncbi:hypothetical protein L917_18196 [Phytophthora nicotianae]|uniref:Uncharacterized protein n=1 Tax=Phytophthora nicotianae TaxID=4792 RepID=W2MG90_PHYNI|nr:hypothetical protein L915_18469 [Phytophthora nicotianae]ETL81478.1 hypothetical protein L917_18196 [Phytophthora nicotianae]ETM34678.1 hypothetical protein L914_18282 [Phytophthora nicotianae]
MAILKFAMVKKSAAQVAEAGVVALHRFPPSLKYRELSQGALLSEWFGHPTLAWAPAGLESNAL